jgi:hypothetical protein
MAGILRTDTIQNSNTSTIITQTNSTTITIGTTGQTVSLASGASQSGFGRAGSVNWDTTPKTTGFTAVSGNGYFVNTTAGAITVNLPSTPAAGDIVAIADYANTSATNIITVGRNGSLIDGLTENAKIKINGQVYTLVYVDATEGWKTVGQTFNQISTAEFVAATGGTITTCGDYKIHSFTGPGTFTVTNAGNPGGSTSVDYLVVAGGGAGGSSAPVGYETGGGGAGGLRTGTSFPVSVTTFPITVGAGGAGSIPGANSGNPSIFSTITSAGGGGGATAVGVSPGLNGAPGGSGGGSSQGGPGTSLGGTGNTPPVSPPQGNPGGASTTPGRGGGGGGSSTAGQGGNPAGIGGSGTDVTPIFGAAPKPFYIADGSNAGPSVGGIFAGGGGGTFPGQAGGPGGGANGLTSGVPGYAGIANTGGGGGGINTPSPPGGAGGSGGSGIVLIRYKYQ